MFTKFTLIFFLLITPSLYADQVLQLVIARSATLFGENKAQAYLPRATVIWTEVWATERDWLSVVLDSQQYRARSADFLSMADMKRHHAAENARVGSRLDAARQDLVGASQQLWDQRSAYAQLEQASTLQWQYTTWVTPRPTAETPRPEPIAQMQKRDILALFELRRLQRAMAKRIAELAATVAARSKTVESLAAELLQNQERFCLRMQLFEDFLQETPWSPYVASAKSGAPLFNRHKKAVHRLSSGAQVEARILLGSPTRLRIRHKGEIYDADSRHFYSLRRKHIQRWSRIRTLARRIKRLEADIYQRQGHISDLDQLANQAQQYGGTTWRYGCSVPHHAPAPGAIIIADTSRLRRIARTWEKSQREITTTIAKLRQQLEDARAESAAARVHMPPDPCSFPKH
ncbi:MAG TPA: hypothetical protein DCR55_01695 [Lentisphaeria bacterium]|nr:hypothetical protein [Lentisphaeria bacterium]